MKPLQDDPLFLAFKREWETEQYPDYTEHPSRSARIAGLCAMGASATFVIALGWWLFGGFA